MPGARQPINHVPVLVDEVLDGLITTADGLYVDGTLGTGGHAAAILSRLSPKGQVLGIDLDAQVLARARERLAGESSRMIFRHGSYDQLPQFLKDLNMDRCQGLILDLGISSFSLEGSGRGFSFQTDEPLDMRFDTSRGQPLHQVLPSLNAGALADILFSFGEDRRSRAIAAAIHAASDEQLTTSGALARAVRSVVKGPQATKSLARVFQALRIFINDELQTLKNVLDQLATVVESGRRIAIISFHSLEDRIVKQFFARESKDCICPPEIITCQCGHRAAFKVLTRRPIVPGPDEQARNPRSRSAKLRVLERL